MLDVILGCTVVGILLGVYTFLVFFPYNDDKVLKSADPEVIKKIPGPKGLPFLGNILMFNVPRESKFNKYERPCVSQTEKLHLIWSNLSAKHYCYNFNAVQFISV
jgi:hypothetical protein